VSGWIGESKQGKGINSHFKLTSYLLQVVLMPLKLKKKQINSFFFGLLLRSFYGSESEKSKKNNDNHKNIALGLNF
jgi:hypothetical protein